MGIDKYYHLFRTSISTIVFQISNYFHSLKETSKKGLFFISNVSGSFLVLVHIEKMQELILNHREYCSNHFHK